MGASAPSDEVIRASELDADGRHDAAIEMLARAAQRGDIEATTRLAKRIVVGDRAPCMRRQGFGLLRDAVKLGGAEAAERLAVLFASGSEGRPDWPAALRLLALSASRGWTPASLQLEVLASVLGDGPSGTPSGKSLQSAWLGSPDTATNAAFLRRLLDPPAAAELLDDPRICALPDFIGRSACDWLIERARGKLKRALVYDVVKQADFADESRTNSAATFHMMDADLIHLLVQARIAAACGQPVAHLEAPAVLHYSVGESIGNHYDFVDPAHPDHAEEVRKRGFRIITFLAYLNADYEGGETVFPKLGLSHSGKRGDGLFFVNTLSDGRADIRTLHNGRPPVQGEKWIFSQFVRNRTQFADE
jgi:prolyl 4-hydroxylase